MLPKSLRLDDKKLLQRILKQGRVWSCSVGRWRFVNAPKPQLTVAVSKKQLKRAVDRNRAKRRIRGLMLTYKDQLPSVASIFYINRSVLKLSSGQLRQEWERCLKNWPKP